jgi:ATP-dependent helicase/nuclease subunit A
MAITFTSQQTRVLQARNHNILVSAAAGSGKTAVLVERIVRMISEGDSPLDIDRLLVVTFTKAAAAQCGAYLLPQTADQGVTGH